MSWDSDWPYHITIERRDWDVVEQWCDANLGRFGETWYKLGIDPAEYVVSGNYSTKWYFKTEQDAVFFKLRWV